MTPHDFITAVLPGAKANAILAHIPVSFTIADAALETGWGTSVRGNNLFGIKADVRWNGPVQSFLTHEVVDGESVEVKALFRAYPSWAESIIDHGKFLLSNPRYKECFTCTNSESFARAVAAAGYATDPEYAEKIIEIINAHNLSNYDV